MRKLGPPSNPLAYVLRLLGRRAHSVEELRQKLLSRGVEESAVAQVLARLAEARLTDDQAFAQSWVRSRDRSRPRAAYLLKQELVKKGITAADVAQALEGREATDVDQARALAEKQLLRLSGLDRDTQRRRVASYLQRRGFSYEVVAQVLP